jgi:hypothetical protein
MVNPLKVEAIVQFPPRCTIPKLQSLQGKANFLRHFVANYVEITKVFMHLLKNGSHYVGMKKLSAPSKN